MAHIHPLYDFTASAFIIYNESVLLLHHKKLGTWLQPGGHIELDEDPEMALWREIEEETGLKKESLTIIEAQTKRPFFESSSSHKKLPIPFDLNVHPFGNDTQHKHIDFCYLIKSDTDKISQNITESNQLKWFRKKDIELLREELIPDIYHRVIFALNTVR